MITHTLKPSELIARISDIFNAKGFHIPQITFQFVCRDGGRQAYGFWITGAPSLGSAEMRELIGLFHSSGFKPLSITKRQSDIVVFALA